MLNVAKVKKSKNNHKAEMTCFKKKKFTMEKRVLFFFTKFSVNN